jgi:Mg2+/citrate symporter
MTYAGLLDPVIDRILRAVGMRPPRIVVSTTLLALVVHLDGSSAATFLITSSTVPSTPVFAGVFLRGGQCRILRERCRITRLTLIQSVLHPA